jgi:hypothetical protein
VRTFGPRGTRMAGVQRLRGQREPTPDTRVFGHAPDPLENLIRLPSRQVQLELPESILYEEIHGPGPRVVTNPSIACVMEGGGKLKVSFRVMLPVARWSVPVLATLNSEEQLTEFHVMRDRTGKLASRDRGALTFGYEDLRLHTAQGRLWATATVCDHGHGSPKVALLHLNDDGDIVHVDAFASPFHEKNWMPIEGELQWVYRADPLVMVSHPSPEFPKAEGLSPVTRGGSPLHVYEGGRLAVTHEVHDQRRYTHRFVRFAPDGTVTKGPRFVFKELGVEFCTGMAPYEDGFVLGFGHRDETAWLAYVTHASLQGLL